MTMTLLTKMLSLEEHPNARNLLERFLVEILTPLIANEGSSTRIMISLENPAGSERELIPYRRSINEAIAKLGGILDFSEFKLWLLTVL